MDEEDENVAHAASYQIQKTQKFEPTEQFARDNFNLRITRMNLTNILNRWVTRGRRFMRATKHLRVASGERKADSCPSPKS